MVNTFGDRFHVFDVVGVGFLALEQERATFSVCWRCVWDSSDNMARFGTCSSDYDPNDLNRCMREGELI